MRPYLCLFLSLPPISFLYVLSYIPLFYLFCIFSVISLSSLSIFSLSHSPLSLSLLPISSICLVCLSKCIFPFYLSCISFLYISLSFTHLYCIIFCTSPLNRECCQQQTCRRKCTFTSLAKTRKRVSTSRGQVERCPSGSCSTFAILTTSTMTFEFQTTKRVSRFTILQAVEMKYCTVAS